MVKNFISFIVYLWIIQIILRDFDRGIFVIGFCNSKFFLLRFSRNSLHKMVVSFCILIEEGVSIYIGV